MEEIHSIREHHKSGGLGDLRTQLCNFLTAHREDFQEFKTQETRAWGRNIEPFTCLKLYILAKKTINFQSEMQSQVDELKQALSEAAKLDHSLDQARFKQEWLTRNAASWRARRILEIIYVLNQDKGYFLELLSTNSR